MNAVELPRVAGTVTELSLCRPRWPTSSELPSPVEVARAVGCGLPQVQEVPGDGSFDIPWGPHYLTRIWSGSRERLGYTGARFSPPILDLRSDDTIPPCHRRPGVPAGPIRTGSLTASN